MRKDDQPRDSGGAMLGCFLVALLVCLAVAGVLLLIGPDFLCGRNFH